MAVKSNIFVYNATCMFAVKLYTTCLPHSVTNNLIMAQWYWDWQHKEWFSKVIIPTNKPQAACQQKPSHTKLVVFEQKCIRCENCTIYTNSQD
jgi:hypothetical protein